MMMPIAPRLLAGQRSDGLLPSQIERDGLLYDDANLFVTALTLRELRRSRAEPDLQRLALDALEREANLRPDGACGFWPTGLRPTWAAHVPSDADDTAMILTELYRRGRITRETALRRALRSLLACRVEPQSTATMPPWISAGCFRTWIGQAGGAQPNPVDCCVNANVAALFALLQAKQVPGYREAVSTIEAGLAWAGANARRLDTLTAFYPAPYLLLCALDHAVECGAEELRGAAITLRRLPAELLQGQPGLCRDAWGKSRWHAAVAEVLGCAVPRHEASRTRQCL